MTADAAAKSKFKIRWRAAILILVCLGVGYLSWTEYLESKGYCSSQSRYLSDEEFLLAALSHVQDTILLEDGETLQMFLRKHSNCCAVRRPTVATTLLENWGQYVVETELNYELTKSRIVGPYPYMTKYVTFTACGARGDTYGEGLSELKSVSPRTSLER